MLFHNKIKNKKKSIKKVQARKKKIALIKYKNPEIFFLAKIT